VKKPRSPPDLNTLIRNEDFAKQMLSEDVFELASRYNEAYLHWDDLYYKDVGHVNREAIWATMKLVRRSSSRHLKFSGLDIQYNLPDAFQKQIHEIDTRSTTGIMPPELMDKKRSLIYSVSSTMEESIASSQIEGAVTTAKAAKTMLRENKRPKNKSEQMIVNNYDAMKFIKTVLTKDLTPELICDIHRIVSKGTMDENCTGKFRDNDDIVVIDVLTEEVSHQPVVHSKIFPMVKDLCDFVNSDVTFVHPIVKGIIIHFMLAYMHPFQDGNGRVSRALFYWYTMKKGYWLMEYLSISKCIKNHSGKYYRAFMLTETDDNDATYFIGYNLDIVVEAIGIFEKYLKKKLSDQRFGLAEIEGAGLNMRQKMIAADMIRSEDQISIESLRRTYQVSVNTARSDIAKLREAGLIQPSSRDGNKILYSYVLDNKS